MTSGIALFVVLLAGPAVAEGCPSGAELADGIISGRYVLGISAERGAGFDYRTDSGVQCHFARVDDIERVASLAGRDLGASPPPSSWTSILGQWRSGNVSTLNVSVPFAGAVALEGYVSRSNSAGAVSVGEFHGTHFGPGEIARMVRVEGTLPGQDVLQGGCYLELLPVGDYLIVRDSGSMLGNCGGYAASFTGIYTR